MVKVDLIYSGYLNAPNGASKFVKKMESLKDKFALEGVHLRVISQDLIAPRDFSDDKEIRRRVSIREKIFSLAKYSVMLTCFIISKTSKRYANQILDYYDTMPDKGEVLAFQEVTTCYYYLKRRKEKKQTVLLTMHNSGVMWIMEYLRLPRLKSCFFKKYRENFEKTIFSGCDKIGFVADLPRKKFCSLYSFQPEKTYYVYNGIDVFSCTNHAVSNTLDLISVGTLCERKNQMGILNAISLLPAESQERINLTLVGDGPSRKALEEKAKDLDSKIIFIGNSNEVGKYLEQANCFILFSKDEGLPISIIEGMRAGLPVISTNIAGIPEQIIDGKTGYLVDVEERKLAEKLLFLVEHIDLLPKMGKDSYEFFLQKFTSDEMVKRYAEIYKDLVLY